MTHQVNDGGEPFTVEGAPWIRVVPLRTPTLPPATHTACYLVGPSEGPGEVFVVDPASPYADQQAAQLNCALPTNIPRKS